MKEYKPIFTEKERQSFRRSEKRQVAIKQIAEHAKATAFAVGVIAVVGIAGAVERGVLG